MSIPQTLPRREWHIQALGNFTALPCLVTTQVNAPKFKKARLLKTQLVLHRRRCLLLCTTPQFVASLPPEGSHEPSDGGSKCWNEGSVAGGLASEFRDAEI